MDAQSTDREWVSYLDQPPVLIAADGDVALARASRTVEAAGLRIADAVRIADAAARMNQQAAASAFWIELDADGGQPMDELLDHVRREAGHARYRSVVSTRREFLDAVVARLDLDEVELLVDADEMERSAALTLAVALRSFGHSVHDAASDKSAVRLRQLSEEVSRIASTLARLSTGPAATARPVEPEPTAEIPEVSAETVRAVIRARQLRVRYFPDELFADPAWDMLLDLLQAEISHLRVPVSSLCIAAAVPATTALRWLKTMVQRGIFVRRADPHDGRRVFVELAPQTSHSLRRYFAEIGQVAVI